MIEYLEIELSKILPTIDVPSKGLIESIKANGDSVDSAPMLMPISNTDYDYKVVYGRRRVATMRSLGIQKAIFAVSDEELAQEDFHLKALIENAGTSNIGGEAIHVGKLIESGYSRKQIVKMTGMTYWVVKNRHDIFLKLIPELIDALRLGLVNKACANELMKLSKEEQAVIYDESNGAKLKTKTVRARLRKQKIDGMSIFHIDDQKSDVVSGYYVDGDNMKKLLSGEKVEIPYGGNIYFLNLSEI